MIVHSYGAACIAVKITRKKFVHVADSFLLSDFARTPARNVAPCKEPNTPFAIAAPASIAQTIRERRLIGILEAMPTGSTVLLLSSPAMRISGAPKLTAPKPAPLA